MAGTLCLLREAGWEIHYLNLSTGNLGSLTGSAAATARTRRKEARAAATLLGAVWHASLCSDLEIFYDTATLRRLCATVREVAPTVILTQSPQDYMEDHVNTARLAVTAAFARGVPNYRSTPPRAPVSTDVTIYHASPHGLRDTLRRRVHPGAFVNTASVHEQKRAALACHASQRQWLEATQGIDNTSAAWTNSAASWGGCRAGSGTRKGGGATRTGVSAPKTPIRLAARSAANTSSTPPTSGHSTADAPPSASTRLQARQCLDRSPGRRPSDVLRSPAGSQGRRRVNGAGRSIAR